MKAEEFPDKEKPIPKKAGFPGDDQKYLALEAGRERSSRKHQNSCSQKLWREETRGGSS